MTIEQAIKILKEPDRIGCNIIKSNDIDSQKYNIDSQMALQMAIQALEKTRDYDLFIENINLYRQKMYDQC